MQINSIGSQGSGHIHKKDAKTAIDGSVNKQLWEAKEQ